MRLSDEVFIWKKGLYPPGHYYSPVTDISRLPPQEQINYDTEIPGINLRAESQSLFLDKLRPNYSSDLFPHEREAHRRYYFKNDYFSYSDGIFLHLIMRHVRPKRIIEIGSGFSSALMLDTNEFYLNNEVDLTFIEPFPEERLEKLLKTDEKATIVRKFVQEVDLDKFKQLGQNDILFVDSSHVSKYESDLNYILFHILPALQPGVIVHFHDVFFPFEYPLPWLRQGRSWNEAYLLRAFLQYNATFEIILFTSYMEGKFRTWFEDNMPMCLTNHEWMELNGNMQMMATTGQSIYIRKV